MRIRSNAARPGHDGQGGLDQDIGVALVREGYLSKSDAEAVRDRMAANGGTFSDTAIGMGVLSEDEMRAVAARQRGAPLMSAGDDRLDPLLVAAFEGDGAYMAKVRAIRSRLIRPVADRDASAFRTCAIIAIDCEQEAAVLATNVAIVTVRGHTPVLLIDAIDARSRIATLLRITPNNSSETRIRETVIQQLWISNGVQDGATSGGGVAEGESILRHADGWKAPGGQLIAVVGVNGQTSAAGVTAAVRGLDSVLLVARKHVTFVAEMQALITGLDNAHVPITGIVLV